MDGFLTNIFMWAVVLIFFYIVGRWGERNHLRRMEEEEATLSHITVEQIKNLPSGWQVTAPPVLVSGSVVLGIDYFKSFKSSLKKIIGGRIGEYERLMTRGRREAIIRMKRMAADQNCNVVWNMRIETSMMSNSRGANNSVEVYVYGTAMRVRTSPS